MIVVVLDFMVAVLHCPLSCDMQITNANLILLVVLTNLSFVMSDLLLSLF